MGHQNESFSIYERANQEDELYLNREKLFSQLQNWNNSIQVYNEVRAVVDQIEEKLHVFIRNVDKEILIAWSDIDKTETYKDAKKVTEQDFDREIQVLQQNLHTKISEFQEESNANLLEFLQNVESTLDVKNFIWWLKEATGIRVALQNGSLPRTEENVDAFTPVKEKTTLVWNAVDAIHQYREKLNSI